MNTKTHARSSTRYIFDRRGVSVGVVLFIMVALGLIMDSVIELNLNAHRRELEQYVWLDAKNAASAAIEYGFAQLTQRFGTNKTIAYGSLAPQNSPLTLPPQFFSTYGKNTGAWSTSKVILPTQATYNAKDTTASVWASRTTDLVGGIVPNSSPTFINGSNPGEEYDPLKNQYITTRTVTVYGKATAQDIRGHKETVYAQEQLQVRDSPLFANAVFYNMNMELAPGPAMTVTGPVHGNQNIYVASNASLNFDGPVTTSASLYHGVNWPNAGSGGSVSFMNTSGTLVSMYQSNTWLDSTQSNFYQQASSLWGGNVQTSLFGVPVEQPVAVQNYVPATGSSNNDLNYGYQLIDPVVANTAANISSGIYNSSVEQQKFSYQAGLTLSVTNVSSANTALPSVALQTYARNSDGTLQYNTNGTPIITTLTYTGTSFYTPQAYNKSNSTITSGIYDQRQNTGYSLVQIDMGKLATALSDTSHWTASGGSVSAAPSNWWNGIVYVATPIKTQNTNSTTVPDDVGISYPYCAVQLINGTSIPNPSFTQSNNIYGTTLATDAPLYVVGNYNSTGNNVISNEPPAAIAADAITVLSSNWNNANSYLSIGSRNASSSDEINAAFLTGIVPSNKLADGTYSGGVENFPRFLEDWTNCTFNYQGSMVGLFESEVATKPWPGTGTVYNPPIRSWSFSTVFAGGTYPPGTPNSRTYKRLNYTEMSATQWTAAMNALKSDLNYW